MAALTFDPTALSRTVRFDGGANSPPAMRRVAGPSQQQTAELTVTGDPDPGDAITLAKVGGAAWLSVPATCSHGVPFGVTIDAADLAAGNYAETVRASHAGYPDADCMVTLAARPMAPKP